MPNFVGLMVSGRCNAKCVYCPVGLRGTGIFPVFMTPEVANAVAKDLEVHGFDGYINVGENGEALLNPSWPQIIIGLRNALPDAKIVLHSNMSLMEEKAARFLLDNGLHLLVFNFDGATPKSFRATRGLIYRIVERNVRNFIKVRNQTGSQCRIVLSVSTLSNFMKNIGGSVDGFYDDSPEIIEKWKNYLRPNDAIRVNTDFWRWMKADSRDLDSALSCPMVGRFETDTFVATDGGVYLCCLDYRASFRFGSVREESLVRLFNTQERLSIIQQIKKRKWGNIGFPCDSCPSRQSRLRIKMKRGWSEEGLLDANLGLIP